METVYQQMANGQERLLEKLATNPDLCNMVLGLLGKIIIISQQRGLPRTGVSTGEITTSVLNTKDVVFRSRIRFSSVARTPPAMWPLQSDFAVYTRAKAHGLGLALQENPKLGEFFQNLVEAIEQYAAQNGFQFGSLKVQRAFISNPGDMLVLQVGKNVLTS